MPEVHPDKPDDENTPLLKCFLPVDRIIRKGNECVEHVGTPLTEMDLSISDAFRMDILIVIANLPQGKHELKKSIQYPEDEIPKSSSISYIENKNRPGSDFFHHFAVELRPKTPGATVFKIAIGDQDLGTFRIPVTQGEEPSKTTRFRQNVLRSKWTRARFTFKYWIPLPAPVYLVSTYAVTDIAICEEKRIEGPSWAIELRPTTTFNRQRMAQKSYSKEGKQVQSSQVQYWEDVEQNSVCKLYLHVDTLPDSRMEKYLSLVDSKIPLYQRENRLFVGLHAAELRGTFFSNLVHQEVLVVDPYTRNRSVVSTEKLESSIGPPGDIADLGQNATTLTGKFQVLKSEPHERLAIALNFYIKSSPKLDPPSRFLVNFTAVEVLCGSEKLSKQEKDLNKKRISAIKKAVKQACAELDDLDKLVGLVEKTGEHINRLSLHEKFERFANRLRLPGCERDIEVFSKAALARNNLVHNGKDNISVEMVFPVESIARKYISHQLSLLFPQVEDMDTMANSETL